MISSLELLQGIICNIERLEWGIWEPRITLGEGHILEGTNLKGGTSDLSLYHDTTRGSNELRDTTLLRGSL